MCTFQETDDWETYKFQLPPTDVHGPRLHERTSKHKAPFESLTVHVSGCTILVERKRCRNGICTTKLSVKKIKFASYFQTNGQWMSKVQTRSVLGHSTSVPFSVSSVFGICPKNKQTKNFKTRTSEIGTWWYPNQQKFQFWCFLVYGHSDFGITLCVRWSRLVLISALFLDIKPN